MQSHTTSPYFFILSGRNPSKQMLMTSQSPKCHCVLYGPHNYKQDKLGIQQNGQYTVAWAPQPPLFGMAIKKNRHRESSANFPSATVVWSQLMELSLSPLATKSAKWSAQSSVAAPLTALGFLVSWALTIASQPSFPSSCPSSDNRSMLSAPHLLADNGLILQGGIIQNLLPHSLPLRELSQARLWWQRDSPEKPRKLDL